MNLSEVFYEAACNMSRHGEVGHDVWNSAERSIFCGLMGDGMDIRLLNVTMAAKQVGWPQKDFRTFMLLMAAEAVK